MKILPLFLTLLFITSSCKEKKVYYKPYLKKAEKYTHLQKNKAEKYTHLQKANFYIRKGSYTLAEKELHAALKIDQEDYKAWFLLGNVYDKMSEDKKAINAYIVGIRLKKRDEKIGSSSLPCPYKSMWERKHSSKP